LTQQAIVTGACILNNSTLTTSEFDTPPNVHNLLAYRKIPIRYNPAIDRPQFASCNAIIVVPLSKLLGPSIGCLQVFNPIGKKGFGRDDLTACKLWVKKISPLLKNYKPISLSTSS
jgi:hypothetical protein